MADREHTKSAVVTGASTGIGRAIAETLIAAGWRVFGSVRKVESAENVANTLGSAFTPLIFDVTDAAAIKAASAKVEAALGGRTLNALVNNAGVAVGGPLRYIPLDEIKRQFDVNVYGVLRVTQAFLPMLGADRRFKGPPGRIINISSVAGKMASPFMAPYAMSKHALEAMSESLRRELIMHGVDVIVIAPGAIRTPIWAKADEIDVEQYADSEYYELLKTMRAAMQSYGDEGLPAAAVGKLALNVLTRRRLKTRYAILRNKFLMWTLPNLLPKRLLDRIVAKRFSLPTRADD